MVLRRVCAGVIGLLVIVGLAAVAPVQASEQTAQVAATGSVAQKKSSHHENGQKKGTKTAEKSGSAKAWNVPIGPMFNRPLDGKAGAKRIINRVIDLINHTGRGQTIRISEYSNDRDDFVNALWAAHKRGVNVQLILNDNWTSDATKRLQRGLGSNVSKKSFVKICTGSCRGGAGNLHAKVFAFSKVAGQPSVMMTGSANTTDRGIYLQWNDLYTMKGVDGLHKVYIKYFNQLKRDRPVSPRWVYYHQGPYSAQFYRELHNKETKIVEDANGKGYTAVTPAPTAAAAKASKIKDPVIQRMIKTNCRTSKGYGMNGRTVIRIAMYGWNGNRGIAIANYVAQKAREGCNIAVIVSSGGGQVVKILQKAGIAVRSADYDFPSGGGQANFYTHQKMMTLNGTYAGHPTRTVWTGSENWSGMSFHNDELVLQIDKRQTYWHYFPDWGYLWDRATHPIGVQPTGMP